MNKKERVLEGRGVYRATIESYVMVQETKDPVWDCGKILFPCWWHKGFQKRERPSETVVRVRDRNELALVTERQSRSSITISGGMMQI